MSRSRNTAACKDKQRALVIFINERLMVLLADKTARDETGAPIRKKRHR